MAGSKAYSSWIKFVILSLALILFIIPFVFLLVNSFKENKAITSNPLSLPQHFNFVNYQYAFDKMNYIAAFSNSLIVTFFSVLLISLCAAMTAHYFVRNNTKLNQYTFLLMVASMIIPFQAIMIPLVKIYGSLNMLNSKSSLIYMYIGFGDSLAVFIYHGFVKGIPAELEEAAFIDGCTTTQTFFRIVFPVLMPTTATVSILNVLWIWNDFLLAFPDPGEAGGAHAPAVDLQLLRHLYRRLRALDGESGPYDSPDYRHLFIRSEVYYPRGHAGLH
ncbi:carbohydrate ABC transporter permease [Paenibacillus sp. P25]|nr:carbohydrate ABC transporter permease [Paenibacillus sp. P25]